jgi:hypothetical protein
MLYGILATLTLLPYALLNAAILYGFVSLVTRRKRTE